MAKAEPQLESVKMTDGRIVDFVGKRKMQKESFVSEDGSISLRVDFRNGETREFPLNPALYTKFAAHGAEQKYGDECAGLEDVEDMVIAMDELHSRLQNGEWTVRREGSGIAGTSTLLRALVEHTGKTVDQIKAFLSNKTQAEKMALRANPKIKPIVDRIEAEKASKAAKVDTSALIAELEG